MEDDKLDGSQIVKLMDQWNLPMWAIMKSTMDDKDPLKQIADVRRIFHSENNIETKVVFQNSFLMSVFESLKQDDRSRFRFQVPSTFITKFVDAVLSEAEAYQKKHNLYLPAVSRDAIHKDLTAWLELAGYLAIGADLAKMDMQDYSKYPDHIIAYLAMVSAYREDKDGFSEFVKKDLDLSESRLAYVWDKLYTIFNMSPDRIRDISPEKIFHYIRKSVRRAFYDYKRKFEKDPILRQIEDKYRREGEKGIDNLFVEIFPYDQVTDELGYTAINETYNSFEDIGKLEELIAIKQACEKLKGIKPEQIADLRDLLFFSATFDLSYSDVGILLGWSKQKVESTRKFYTRHKESFQKKLNS